MKKANAIYLAYLLFFSCTFTACAQKGAELLSKFSHKAFDGKEYFLYVVKAEDGVGSIMNLFSVTERELNNANPEIFVSEIKPGMTVKVPVLKWNDNIAQHDEFLYHTVLRDQSIYFISKKYAVDINEIYANNPDVKNGIKVGMKLKLPNNPINLSLANLDDDQIIHHKVRANETLLSIAQTFGIDIGTIRQLNPELAEGLKPGQIVKIPKNDATSKVEATIIETGLTAMQFPCENFNYRVTRDTFHVAILLPFELADNEKLNTLTEDYSKSRFTRSSEKIIEYYEGILLAVDSLKQLGLNLSLHVYDTEKNVDGIKKILAKPELTTMDLIIGPAYSSVLKYAAEFAKAHRINIVSPLSQNDELLTVNKFLLQAKPSLTTSMAQLAKYLSLYADQNLVVLHTNTAEELDFVKTLKSKADDLKQAGITLNIKEVNYVSAGLKGLVENMSETLENYIVIPSVKEAYVTDILTRLNVMSKAKKIAVFGMIDWQRYNVDQDYFQNLKVHYITNVYVNYSNPETREFVVKYRNSFMTDPGSASFQGFDLMLYFGEVLMKYGADFQGCLGSLVQVPLKPETNPKFQFQRVSADGGLENNAVQIVRYDEDFNLIRIDPSLKINYFAPKATEDQK
jgi:LysM repeat protein